MNLLSIIGITVFLVAVFSVLGFWHRSIQAAEDREKTENIRTAEAEGANQALTQHPQIDLNLCLGCGTCVSACPERGVLALVEGKALLVNASHCVGHGCCETACPVGALTVGLGDVSQRTDIPSLTEEHETSVPGVFISGELGGIGLIRNAVTQGADIIQTIAGRLKTSDLESGKEHPLDVLIVGSGPSGIAAALKAHELELNYLIIDQDDLGGTVRKYPRNKMTLTQPVDLPLYGRMKRTQYSKEELIDLWETLFEETGITVKSGVKLTGLNPTEEEYLSAETTDGLIHCRHCILALGRRGTPRRLGVPGEESERVLYQLTDAADYTDQDLLVVGGGDSAIEATLALAVQPGNRVTLSYRRNAFFRIKPRNRTGIEEAQAEGRITVIFDSQVTNIASDEVTLSLASERSEKMGERIVHATQVFIFAGGEPPYPLLKNMGVQFGGPSDARKRLVRMAG